MLKPQDKIEFLEENSVNLFYQLRETTADITRYIALMDILLRVEEEIRTQKTLLQNTSTPELV